MSRPNHNKNQTLWDRQPILRVAGLPHAFLFSHTKHPFLRCDCVFANVGHCLLFVGSAGVRLRLLVRDDASGYCLPTVATDGVCRFLLVLRCAPLAIAGYHTACWSVVVIVCYRWLLLIVDVDCWIMVFIDDSCRVGLVLTCVDRIDCVCR